MGNVLVLAGIHLNPPRIIALVGGVRIAWDRWISGYRLFRDPWNSVDRAFFWCVICHVIAFILLWHSAGALTNQFGYLWSELGIIFCCDH